MNDSPIDLDRPDFAVAEFVRLMTLEETGPDAYAAPRPSEQLQHLFGGQVLAQVLAAATRATPGDRLPHALQADFLRGGDGRLPIAFRVERVRDGRSFSTRRVIASQEGREILTASVSFHVPEDGLGHQSPPPEVRGPEGLPAEAAIRAAEARAIGRDMGHVLLKSLPVDFRPVDPVRFSRLEAQSPQAHYWIGPLAPMAADAQTDRTLRFCLLAYLSDLPLLLTALRPHGLHYAVSPMDSGSLNHSLWLHAVPTFDDWMLWSTETPWTGAGRGFVRGTFFDARGRMIANAAQEGLMRVRPGG